ncbi:class I SAM-dependent methyltransferase [uncultured Sunxiuqinia sp.]|uniref:class I SAM-dependent methyltransferase n=1 Tax=uncultured Sunxiuqinia sp. TaxID=1573825 RepID=UPI002629D4BE|nr:class I SAM-dependent methyltransferase [uncultured Sunxiuqinia sp.]
MNGFDRKKHWEHIYQTKSSNEVSWFESVPQTSLNFFSQFQVPLTAKIIDIGGGDSLLVDHLLDRGYQNLTILDISEAAINRAKERLQERASRVKWIVADAATFQPTERYDFWHDRAAFHFLTQEDEIANYLQTAQQSINPSGVLVIGTFSEQGPDRCSGIPIKRYSEKAMTERLETFFEKIKCITVDHQTPFSSVQNFVFCSFRKV